MPRGPQCSGPLLEKKRPHAADIFTKSLGRKKFEKFQAFILGLPQDGEVKALICRMLFM